MDKVLVNAMQTMTEACYNIVHEFLELYYDEYDPEHYRRINQFLESCVTTNVYRFNGNYYADIFIDYENLHYKLREPKLVVEWANEGLHGGYDVTAIHHHFWDEAWDKLNRRILVQNFIRYFEKYTGCELRVR